MDANLVEIFYLVDEFCKEFYKTMEGHVFWIGLPRFGLTNRIFGNIKR